MAQALDGIRILDLSNYIAGPFAAMLLADMGAAVVKIENTSGGDPFRKWGQEPRMYSPLFRSYNRNKRSMTLNLRDPEGKEIFLRMAAAADVVIENYRPGVMKRLELGYERLNDLNPRLVYCGISAFGQSGPYRERPGFDTLGQCLSGLLSQIIDPKAPAPPGLAFSDHLGGLFACYGILIALMAREKTGKGQKVDACIYGTVIAMQPMEINYTSISGLETRRAGRGHQFLQGVWGSFPTRDGWLCLAGVDDKRWPDFCRVMGIEHVRDEHEYSDNVIRNFRGEKIEQLLDEVFPTKTTDEWMALLNAIDVLATPVQDYRDILNSEQALANGYISEMDHPQIGKVKVVGTPLSLSETPLSTATPPPELGQHSEEVLLEAGFSWQDIAEFRSKEVV